MKNLAGQIMASRQSSGQHPRHCKNAIGVGRYHPQRPDISKNG